MLIAQQENLLVPNYGTGLCSSPDTGICCSVKSSSFFIEKLMPCKGILGTLVNCKGRLLYRPAWWHPTYIVIQFSIFSAFEGGQRRESER